MLPNVSDRAPTRRRGFRRLWKYFPTSWQWIQTIRSCSAIGRARNSSKMEPQGERALQPPTSGWNQAAISFGIGAVGYGDSDGALQALEPALQQQPANEQLLAPRRKISPEVWYSGTGVKIVWRRAKPATAAKRQRRPEPAAPAAQPPLSLRFIGFRRRATERLRRHGALGARLVVPPSGSPPPLGLRGVRRVLGTYCAVCQPAVVRPVVPVVSQLLEPMTAGDAHSDGGGTAWRRTCRRAHGGGGPSLLSALPDDLLDACPSLWRCCPSSRPRLARRGVELSPAAAVEDRLPAATHTFTATGSAPTPTRSSMSWIRPPGSGLRDDHTREALDLAAAAAAKKGEEEAPLLLRVTAAHPQPTIRVTAAHPQPTIRVTAAARRVAAHRMVRGSRQDGGGPERRPFDAPHVRSVGFGERRGWYDPAVGAVERSAWATRAAAGGASPSAPTLEVVLSADGPRERSHAALDAWERAVAGRVAGLAGGGQCDPALGPARLWRRGGANDAHARGAVQGRHGEVVSARAAAYGIYGLRTARGALTADVRIGSTRYGMFGIGYVVRSL